MENTGFKGILTTIWQRVILSYKSTLIGIGVQILCILADELVKSPNRVITIIGSVILGVLALYKSPTLAPKPPTP